MMIENITMKNPLIPEILSLLERNPLGVSEYEILKKIDIPLDIKATRPDDDNDDLELFQKHFIIMNALYSLQKKLWEEDNLLLTICPLRIFISNCNINDTTQQQEISKDSSLSDYYLDWDNLKNTTKQDVQSLLTNFWTTFVNLDKKNEALSILGLKNNATSDEIKTEYRKLIKKHHPDKGGNNEAFIKIRKAFEILHR